MLSVPSSGTVVSVPASASSPSSPPSSGDARIHKLAALSLTLLMYEERLPRSWQLFQIRASICAGVIWLTFADPCGTLQCLLRIVGSR